MSGAANQQPEDPGPSPPPRRPPPTVTKRYDVAHSCIRCHERKVRCDKTTPCMTCVRSNVPCRYPGPERSKRRSQKTASAKVASRLEVLERTVAAFNHAGGPVTGREAVVGSPTADPAPPLPSNPTPGHNNSRNAPSDSDPSGGFLLKDGSSTRYINEFTFSRVLEKVWARSVPDSQKKQNHCPVLTWHFGAARRASVCHRYAREQP